MRRFPKPLRCAATGGVMLLLAASLAPTASSAAGRSNDPLALPSIRPITPGDWSEFDRQEPEGSGSTAEGTTPEGGVAGDLRLHPADEAVDRFSFSARDLDIRDALALFARTYGLNIVSDPEVTGTVTVDFSNLTLDVAMEAILDAHGYYAENRNGLIRVRRTMTRSFTIDYIRLIRGGNGVSTANIASGSESGGFSSGAATGAEVANISINQSDSIRFWDELAEQLTPLLGEDGRMAINRMAGQIMVTDSKDNVERVGDYLENVSRTLHRQVDIEARIYEVALNDQFQLGINWENVTGTVGDYAVTTGGPGTGIPVSGTIIENAFGGGAPGAPSLSLAITHEGSRAVVDALSLQGEVEVVSQPRIRTLNNQAALIKVGQDKPFFRQTSTVIAGSGNPTTTSSTEVQIVTIGTILSITPQIAEDGWITLDVSPVITRLVGTAQGPDGSTAPEVDVKQTSTLVRVRDNSTVVLGGLIQNEQTKTVRKVPLLGDIPLLGHAFRGRFTTERKTELVIFITPTIVR